MCSASTSVVEARWLGAQSLDGAQIFGRRFAAATISDDIEGDLLSLIEGAHSGALDRADVDEHIIVAVLRLDKAEALLAIEPLHGSLVHGKFPYISDARVKLRARCRAARLFDFG